MSGIVGILQMTGRESGAPVDRRLLASLTDSMAFRGPDAQAVWCQGRVGFGHTMLRTTDEATYEHQPFSPDGKIWIVADARIDDREQLVRKLKARGVHAAVDRPDVELILHAYQAWGEACVEHLLGDFAFAIWDEPRHKLFCARDHFGVKPFFYAQAAGALIFSNTLDCVRRHPAVSDTLDEQFIGDFLLFDAGQDEAATVFADIRRLPPAHCLTASIDGVRLRRYWSLPEPGLVYLKRPGDYVEQFNELFTQAVADRLRTRSINVQMSGGLDSTAVAAVAHRQFRKQNADFDLRAYTIFFKRLFVDEEPYYAEIVADELRIPIRYHVADDYEPLAHFDRPEIQTPEPCNDPAMAMAYDQYWQMAKTSRVVLTGTDGDTVLQELPNLFFKYLFEQRRFGKLLNGMWWFMRAKRQLPRVGVRAALRQWRNPESSVYELPVWINRDFARRLDLAGRLRQINEQQPHHPFRPRACRVMRSPLFSQALEPCDPGITNAPIEWRHPFADLRLVNFLLTVPPVPWLVEKELLKQAMRGNLPEAVIERPKTPLAVDPLTEELRRGNNAWAKKAARLPEIGRWVEPGLVGDLDAKTGTGVLWETLRPACLNHWLVNLNSANQAPSLEVKIGYRKNVAATNGEEGNQSLSLAPVG